jgi:hypothetical protein
MSLLVHQVKVVLQKFLFRVSSFVSRIVITPKEALWAIRYG